MNIMSICDNADVLKVVRIVKIIIQIIKIAGPIMLMISSMLDYMRAVRDNDNDALYKANKSFVTRVIASIILFFIPTFIGVIAHSASFDSSSYTACLNNATKERINEITVDNAKIYLESAKKSLKNSDYNLAYTQINKISDNSSKSSMLKELEEVKKAIKEKEEKEKKERESHQKSPTPSSGGSSSGGSSSYGGSTSYSLGVSGNVENTLGVFYYTQCDSRWGKIEYDIGGGPNGGHATVCSSACGYTSFAMIAGGLNNDTSINPYSVIKSIRGINDGQLTHRGYGAASWDDITNSKHISKYHLSAQNISRSNIESALRSGRPVIALVPGHYVVLSISSRGYVVLLDPFTGWGDRRKKSGEYKSVSDIEAIYGRIQNAYAYAKI